MQHSILQAKHFFLTALFAVLIALPAATFADENSPRTEAELEAQGYRLIEARPGLRDWMSPKEITALARKNHEKGRCGGFFDVTEHRNEKPLFLEPVGLYDDRTPRHHRQVEPRLQELSAARILATVNHLATYQNRYYKSQTGVQSQEWIHDEFERLAAHRSDVSVRMVEHSFMQPSVVATIEGTGERKNEIIVIGGHADSINWSAWFPSPRDRAPGADDNASGTATLMEIYRVLVESDYRPARTIEFMAYAGEERGLLGSQDIANRYKNEIKRVVGVVQFDMTMYPGTTRQMTLINDFVHEEQTAFMGRLIDEYVGVRWGLSDCGYGCSDHASWTKAGYPAAFPFEAPFDESNPNIHKASDTVSNGLDEDFALSFAKLGLSFAIEMSAGE